MPSAAPSNYVLGPCGTADSAGDCGAGHKGSWTLTERQTRSWEAAAAACERRCLACGRCNYVSFSLRWRDCSWFHECDLGALRHDVYGFLSVAVANGSLAARGGKRHGRARRQQHGPLRVAALRRPLAAPTPYRSVPVRPGQRLAPPVAVDEVDDGAVPLPAPSEVGTSPHAGAPVAPAPLAWGHTPVFWPDELEQGPCFRIPSVVQTAGGELVAFAEARRGSCLDASAHQIAARISSDGGDTWGGAFVAAGNETHRVGNPTAVVLSSGRLLLLMAMHTARCAGQCVADTLVSHSDDGGRSWTPARSLGLPRRARGRAGPGAALQLRGGGGGGSGGGGGGGGGGGVVSHEGRVLVSVSSGTYGHDWVVASDDGGGTWRLANDGVGLRKMDEAQLAQLPNGSVLLLMRHRREATRGKAVAVSHDGGDTFGELSFDARLPGPLCQASLTSVVASRSSSSTSPSSSSAASSAPTAPAVYFSGPGGSSAREALVVRRSTDSGATWGATHSVDPAYAGYSCLVAPLPLARGCAAGVPCGGVLYEAAGMVLRFARFPLNF